MYSTSKNNSSRGRSPSSMPQVLDILQNISRSLLTSPQSLPSSIARSTTSFGCSHSHGLSHAVSAASSSSSSSEGCPATLSSSTPTSATTMGSNDEFWYCHRGLAGGAAAHYAGPWLLATTTVCLTCDHHMCPQCRVTKQAAVY